MDVKAIPENHIYYKIEPCVLIVSKPFMSLISHLVAVLKVPMIVLKKNQK